MVPGSLTEDGAVALLDSNTRDEPLIRLENIHVSYPVAGGPPKKVLNGIDLTIERGQFVSVVGRNGLRNIYPAAVGAWRRNAD